MVVEGDFVQFTEEYIAETKEKVYQKIFHSYLSSQLELPEIDHDKLFLLLNILQCQDLPKEQFDAYVTTVMYIQIALDTHDRVKNDDEDMPHQKRQLTVLAGDFYSGLYYHSLSNVPNIHLIRRLAEGIKIVNENKIKIYNKEVLTFNEYMQSMMYKETAIYQQLAYFFNHPHSEILSTNWLHVNQIIKEKNQYISYIKENDLLKTSTVDEHELHGIISKQIDNYIELKYSPILNRVPESLIEGFLERTAANKEKVSTIIS